MAPSFDYTVSSLLCAEEEAITIFGDDNYGGFVDDYSEIGHDRLDRNQPNLNQNHLGLGFSGFLTIELVSEDCLAAMFEREKHHLPRFDFLKRLKIGDLDLEARNEAIDWIQKVHSHYKFGPLCLYLSINYMDRFLSVYELPGKAWMMQLLAVASLSIAAKMEESQVPQILDLQVGEAKFVFEAKAIQRMEILVSSTLKWRMQAVTPFSFIDHFLYKINGDQMPPKTLISQSTQLILSTIKGTDLLEFKPSEIAAAVAISISVTEEEHSVKALSFLSDHVEKERLIKCVELINELKGTIGSASTSVPHSPIGVLDASSCLSYKSDDTDTSTPSASCANSAQNSPASKRRRLNRTLQLEF